MKKPQIKFNELFCMFQEKYGKDHDIIFYEIVFALSKKVKAKDVLIALREQPIDFKIKDYEKMLDNYFVKQMPLAHVVGSTTFMGLRFNVSEKVLAPRDVTEKMVSDFIACHKSESYHEVIDMCCGSGCIGVSIKKFIPQFKVTCVDKYWPPIFDTAMNGKNHQTELTVDVKDAFEYLNKLSAIDILISNPPYINEQNFNNSKMFKYENKKALIAEENGLYFFRRFFEYLNNHPFTEAWFEYGYDQRQVLSDLLKTYTKFSFIMPEDKQYIVIKPNK